ncbi:MAG: DUF2141 domain-containing protein [Planctomycetales bacterium]|nr:DUF2141 domain-containing protein [Planctomycetales bacterium]
MLKSILKSWNENRGNLLLAFGSVAGLLMCLVWYFDLVPEVRLIARSPSTLVSANGPRSAPTSLVGIVRVPARERLPQTSSSELTRAVVEIYPPQDTIPEKLFSPLLVQDVALPDAGGPMAVVFNDLPPGKYAGVAFIDLNSNGRFDVEESGAQSEPFSLARLTGPPREPTAANKELSGAESSTDEEPELPAGIFELEAGRATLIVFDFESAEPGDSERATQPALPPKAPRK